MVPTSQIGKLYEGGVHGGFCQGSEAGQYEAQSECLGEGSERPLHGAGTVKSKLQWNSQNVRDVRTMGWPPEKLAGGPKEVTCIRHKRAGGVRCCKATGV